MDEIIKVAVKWAVSIIYIIQLLVYADQSMGHSTGRQTGQGLPAVNGR